MRLAAVLSGLVLAWSLAPSTATAADPQEIGINQLDNLLRGADVYLEPGGSYVAAFDVEGFVITTNLRFELPPEITDAEPGPIVVFWQFAYEAADVEFGDISNRMVNPPHVQIVDPVCSPSGGCTLALGVTGSTRPALQAADLDWVAAVGVRLLVTVVRTYGDGSQAKLSAPGFVDQAAGTLASPPQIDGPLISTGIVDLGASNPVEVPGPEFGLGGPPYDWATALAAVLGTAPSPASTDSITSIEPTLTSSPTPAPGNERLIPPWLAVVAVGAAVAMAVAVILAAARRRS